MKFQSTDATLLQAILFGCGSSSVTLNSVLNTLVSLEREMLTFSEFDGGLARLQAGGLVSFSAGRITPTLEAMRLAEELAVIDGCPDTFHGHLLELLQNRPIDDSSIQARTTGMLCSAAFDNAFE
jgi:hypothetical protein